MSISPLDDRHWTFDDLVHLPDDGRRYEVVDGQLVVSPRAAITHDRVANRLSSPAGPAAARGPGGRSWRAGYASGPTAACRT